MSAQETIEVLVGRIGKPHGLRGHVTIDVRTDEPEKRFAPDTVLKAVAPKGSAFPYKTLTIEAGRWHQGVLHLLFSEVVGREGAEAARGVLLYADIPADSRPDDPDEYYDHQLIGLEAWDLEGALRGEVIGLIHGGAQDMLQIRTPDKRTALVPFVTALVPTVDLEAGRVVVADRPGLITPLDDED